MDLPGSCRVLVVAALAVAAGCRAAPPPLHASFDSPQALAQSVIARVASGDEAYLRSLELTRDEFETHIWPHLPVNRPGTNMPMAFVWDRLHQSSQLHLAQTLAREKAARYELVDVAFRGDTSEYGSLRVMRRSELIVRTPDGTVETVRLFGSVVTDGTRYKVFSYVVD